MRKVALILSFILATTLLAFAAPGANQAIDFNTLNANQSGNFLWVSSAPSGSNRLITYSDYKTYVQNQTTSCTVPGLNNNYVMTWNDVISCASAHTASLQSQSVSGNYSTVSYTATFNATTGLYQCHGPFGADSYTGTPITLPAGTVAPGASTPLRLQLTSITFSGSSSLTVALKNPSGAQVQTWSSSTSTLDTGNYTTTGAAGAWSWVITQTGGADGGCDVNSGAAGGGAQVTWSGTATWYQ